MYFLSLILTKRNAMAPHMHHHAKRRLPHVELPHVDHNLHESFHSTRFQKLCAAVTMFLVVSALAAWSLHAIEFDEEKSALADTLEL